MSCRWISAAIVLGLGLSVGCRSKFPPTQRWEIKVVLKGTGQPLPSGTIELQSVEDPTLKGFGDIGPNGIADIVTVRGPDEIRGVVAGEHKVRIESRREGGAKLPVKYKDFETSGLKIKVPGPDNPVILHVEGALP